jgi:L-threonylcarbamoyladenylate synthase
MQTKIVRSSDISEAIASLKRGNPVIFPTETVYGLGAPLFNERAVKKIFEIKGRPSDNPLIAHISSLDQAEVLAEELDDRFYTLAESFWPGPLAIVVKRRPGVPALVSAGHPTIAIRMPSHLVARKLIDGLGEAIVAPSANMSGRPSPTRVEDALEDLNGKVEFAIDGGVCAVGIESSVISLVGAVPTLLRPGKITREMLEEVLGCSVALAKAGDAALSPGMKYRHYAPKGEVRLVFRLEELKGPFILPTQQNLYAQLREADRKGMGVIEIFCDAGVQSDAALMNRLLRAAGQIG